MPEEFLKEMKELLTEEEYKKLLDSYLEKPKRSIKLQLDKISSKELEQIVSFQLKSIPMIDGSYYIEEEKIGNHPYHHAGLFYVQEPSAMLPPLLVPLKSSFKVLDLCASPGGKTLALSNQVPNGFVLANEINYNRAKKLLSNVERLGLKNVVVSSMSSKSLKNIYQEYFDVILIDAPCSGEGMFRKDETARRKWSKEKIDELSQIQKELLEDSVSMLKENGYLIYSTCTFNKKENEEQIIDFLSKHSFEIIDIPSKFDSITNQGVIIKKEYSTDKARRCYPFLYGEGQFMIVIQKKEKTEYKNIEDNLTNLSNEEMKIVTTFMKENLKRNDYIIKKCQNNIVILPHSILIPKMTLLSCFVKMGEIEKERFIPHHQFVKAYGIDFINKLSLSFDDNRTICYLKGEEIEGDVEDGYGVLMVDGYPLGLFKAKNKKLKNHYPKGLRYQNN